MSNEPASAAGPADDAGDDNAVGRLRADFAEVARSIAATRAAFKAGGDVGALLDDLEARTQRLLGLLLDPPGAAPDPEPPAEPDRVPTVSDVVGRDAEPPHDGATTVAMLEAMVAKLADEMPLAEAPPAEPPAREPTIPEVELLSNFARMEAVPYLPPEIGTAVIFEPKPKAAETPVEAPAATTPEDGAEPDDAELESLLFEPAPQAEADPAAFLLDQEPAPEPAPDNADPLAPLKAMSDEERIALFE